MAKKIVFPFEEYDSGDDICFICRKPMDRSREYISLSTQREYMPEEDEIEVIEAEETLVVCSEECYEKLGLIFVDISKRVKKK